jgi:glyoxalase family protein
MCNYFGMVEDANRSTSTGYKGEHMRLDGIHHISAITGDAPRNVDFYTRVLGLRMTAKTVNQDDPGVYHLFYGDELARPGADLTFFEYPGAVPGRPGAGMVHRIVSRVGSAAALDFWAARLSGEGVAVSRSSASAAQVPSAPAPATLRFADPEGLEHELVVSASDDPALIAEHPEVPAEYALLGFEGVRAFSRDPAGSAAMLERLMGAARVGDEDRWELRGSRRGGWIAFDPAPAERGRQSAGVVHHVAFGTSDEDLPAWIARVGEAGVPSSGYVDRHYFHSLYFREPGGVLYELATAEPGFTVDGPVEELGTKLILPPFLEPRREEIAARLTPLPDPRAGWATTSAPGARSAAGAPSAAPSPAGASTAAATAAPSAPEPATTGARS